MPICSVDSVLAAFGLAAFVLAVLVPALLVSAFFVSAFFVSPCFCRAVTPGLPPDVRTNGFRHPLSDPLPLFEQSETHFSGADRTISGRFFRLG